MSTTTGSPSELFTWLRNPFPRLADVGILCLEYIGLNSVVPIPHPMADMQSTPGGHDGEGLWERKPPQAPVDVLQEDGNHSQDASSDESRENKKTFGRTPDGVGTTALHSSTAVFLSYPLLGDAIDEIFQLRGRNGLL